MRLQHQEGRRAGMEALAEAYAGDDEDDAARTDESARSRDSRKEARARKKKPSGPQGKRAADGAKEAEELTRRMVEAAAQAKDRGAEAAAAANLAERRGA